jgi:hypothetical protein
MTTSFNCVVKSHRIPCSVAHCYFDARGTFSGFCKLLVAQTQRFLEGAFPRLNPNCALSIQCLQLTHPCRWHSSDRLNHPESGAAMPIRAGPGAGAPCARAPGLDLLPLALAVALSLFAVCVTAGDERRLIFLQMSLVCCGVHAFKQLTDTPAGVNLQKTARATGSPHCAIIFWVVVLLHSHSSCFEPPPALSLTSAFAPVQGRRAFWCAPKWGSL